MIGTFKLARPLAAPFVCLGIVLSLAAPPAARGQRATSSPAPLHLSCDAMHNPLGIDGLHPRLSWQQPEVGRNIQQSAYEILVSTRPGPDAKPDIWDSGHVASDESVDVAYAGPTLQSTKRYYWRVRIWNRNGGPSAYSAPGWWEMGLLSPRDWHAQWIAYDPEIYRNDRKSNPKWIWTPGEPALHKPKHGNHQFRLDFNLSQVPKDATLFITGKDTVAVWLNGQRVLAAESVPPWGPAYPWGPFKVVPVGKYLKNGKNVLAAQVFADAARSGSAGLIAMLRIRMPDGSFRRLVSNPDWKATFGASGDWFAPNFNDDSWHRAVVVGAVGAASLGIPWPARPADLLRHTFSISKTVRRARVYITALGSYQFHLNGKRIGNQILAPGWTDYQKQEVYQTYDVTANLHQGKNAMGALLGDGWYATGLISFQRRYNYGPPPTRLMAQLEITYADGSHQVFVTDGSWKASPSAVLSSEIYNGEIYDARLKKIGWDDASYSAAGWSPVTIEPAAKGQLRGQNFQPIRIEKIVRPVSVSNPKPGVYVFDMGQNMVGWERLHVRGPRGTKVTMRFGEVLKNGQFYQQNMRSAKETDTYTLSGKGEEVFQPHFTYHGFRYVEVTGYPGTPTRDSIQGVVFHTDAPFSMKFHTGSPLVNQLWSNILWGQRGNFESVPTDCPQRDERLGWMGDAEVFWRTATYNMNLDAFSHKFTRDIREAQEPDGGYTNYSPRVGATGSSSPGWADAGVIIPWTTYVQYGDTSIIRENWSAMQHWMDHLQQANPNYLWLHERGNDFGDWLAIGSVTSKDLIATAYWAYDASLMSQMAAAVNKPQEAEKYRQLFRHIRAAFDHAYVKPDGTVANGSQTSYVLALHMQLLPKALRPKAADKLVADIKAHQWHLTTGFLGTPYIMIELSKSGHSDVAYRLLLNTSFPSWGYMIRHGATTMWERWNGNQMLNNPSMNSFNHYAYGAVGEWLYRYAAGIDENVVDGPGFHRIVLHPQFDSNLGQASATYDSAYGPITSAWKDAGNKITWHVVVPPNTTALLRFPTADTKDIAEPGKRLGKDAKLKSKKEGSSFYEVGSGTYDFTVRQ